MSTTTKKTGIAAKCIKFIERAGNKLPHPFILFGIFILVTLLISFILSKLGFEATYLDEGKKIGDTAKMVTVKVVNLLTFDNMRKLIVNLPDTYVRFPSLKIVLIVMMAIGVVEETGFFNVLMRKYLLKAPKSLITAVLIFVCVNSNIMSGAGVILAFTIGGVLFASIGRNPKLGIILDFAACSGGYTSNILISGTDALLAGITEQAASSVGVNVTITPLCNYYFMAVSTIFLTLTLTWVTEKFMVKITGGENFGLGNTDALDQYKLTQDEEKGLKYSFYGFLFFAVVMAVLTLPSNAFFRNANGAFLPNSPLLSSLVPIIFFLFVSVGIGFGIGVKKITSSRDVPKFLQKGVAKAVPLLVTILSSAVFIELLNKSNIFKIMAIKGSFILKNANVGPLPLLILVAIITAVINPFMVSGSTKWVLLSPMIVPMLAFLNISPAFAQLAFRIGDSATNIISPLRSDIPVILGLMAQYDEERRKRGISVSKEEEAGFGTIFSLTLPYSIVIFVTLAGLMVIWYFLGLPIGPGEYLFIK